MPLGPLGGDGIVRLAVLEYEVLIETPTEMSRVELENIVVGAVETAMVPDTATRGVESLDGIEGEISVVVETENRSTSQVTLNEIKDKVNKSVPGRVTSVSVKAVPTNAVKQLVNRIMDN